MTLRFASAFTDTDRVDVVYFRVVALRLGGDIAIGEGPEDLPEVCWATEPWSAPGSAAWVAWRTAQGLISAEHLHHPTLKRQFHGMAAFCAWITRVWREAAEGSAAKTEWSVVAAFSEEWQGKLAYGLTLLERDRGR